jgi:hypothetical protein
LAKSSLTSEDKQALAKVGKQTALIREMVTALRTFWKSNKKDDGAKYEKTRLRVWTATQDLLGLEKDE